MISFLKYFIFSIGIGITGPLYGQYLIGNLDLDKDVSNWYDSTIKIENTVLIRGSFYPFVTQSVRSHEYYLEKNWQRGKLTYKGQTFEVSMLYNTFRDLLLIQNETNLLTKTEPLKLAQYLISEFEIGNNVFKRFEGNQAPDMPGFYQVLFEAPEIKILVKKTKKEHFENGPEGYPAVAYYSLDHYFLILQNQRIKIKNKSAFFQAYPIHKQEIKNFIKSNTLLIKPNQYQYIKRLAMYCHQMGWKE